MRRGISCSITPVEFQALIGGDCHYCGCTPFNWTKLQSTKNIQYNGIDRVDQTKPYELGNVVSCCKHCNSMKSRSSESAFLSQVQKIFHHNRNRTGVYVNVDGVVVPKDD